MIGSTRRPRGAYRYLAAALLVGLAGTATAGVCPPRPSMILGASIQTTPGIAVTLPLDFGNSGYTISAIAFSLDLDPSGLAFDATDANLDGIPDAVTLPAGMPPVVVVAYDPGDTDGELDVLLADLSGTPLPVGVIVEVELTPSQSDVAATWVRFSSDPPPSFSDDQGDDVAGIVLVLGSGVIFTDGFESGDTCAWASSQP